MFWGDIDPKDSEGGLTKTNSMRGDLNNKMGEFKLKKLEIEAQKNWDRFYRRNSSKFFKDRNWTKIEIESFCKELNLNDQLIFIDAGCGCGNTIFPLIACFPNWAFYGIDFSKNAIDLLHERSSKMNLKVMTKVADLTSNTSIDFPLADMISLIFVLSSISKCHHKKVINNVKAMVKSDGCVIFRDYGAFDHSMLRFDRNSMISDRFYARQDGTRAYYFYTDELREIFEDCGFQTIKCDYVFRKTENFKEEICIERTFIEGIFTLK